MGQQAVTLWRRKGIQQHWKTGGGPGTGGLIRGTPATEELAVVMVDEAMEA